MPVACIIPPPARKGGRGSFKACQRYIAGQTQERGIHRFWQGVASFQTASIEMEAAADRSRCRDPVCHWVISYRSDEPSTIDQIESDTSRLLEAIQLKHHQFVAVVHDDTDHRHVHIVANQVGPDGRASRMSWCRRESERRMAEVAIERGVPVVPGRHNQHLLPTDHVCEPTSADSTPRLSRLNQRDRRRLESRGVVPWSEIARPIILAAAQAAKAWPEFETVLAQVGIVLKRIVRRSPKTKQVLVGLAFCEGADSGAPGCKASDICTSVRFASLVKRWGDYPTQDSQAALLNDANGNEAPVTRRTSAAGREAARQRRAIAAGAALALAPIPWTSKRKTQRITPAHQTVSSDVSAPGTPAESITGGIGLDRIDGLAQGLSSGMAGRRRRALRAKRRERWTLTPSRSDTLASSGTPASQPVTTEKVRLRLEQRAMRDRASNDPIVETARLKRLYDWDRVTKQKAVRQRRRSVLAEGWVNERGRRSSERAALAARFAAKNAMALRFVPGPFQEFWLWLLRLRKHLKLRELSARQRQRWRETRMQLLSTEPRATFMQYREWLHERAASCPISAQQDQWLRDLDQRRRGDGHNTTSWQGKEPAGTEQLFGIEAVGSQGSDPQAQSRSTNQRVTPQSSSRKPTISPPKPRPRDGGIEW